MSPPAPPTGEQGKAGRTGPPGAPPDPNYILSQEEFHAAMREQHERELAGDYLTRTDVRREADGLRETAGWIAVSFACWLLLIGYALIKGYERGRPPRG